MNAINSRGYRNKNPGNIDYNPANKWQGQVGKGDGWLPAAQRRFAEFESHEYGIRALIALLTTYQTRYNLRSIEQIVHRWAPGNENNTEAYIKHVVALTGFERGARLDMRLYAHAAPLVAAIITHELGGNPYDEATIRKGLELYGVVEGVQQNVSTAREALRTGTGRAAAGTAAAGVSAAVVVEALQQIAPHISALSNIADQVGLWPVVAAMILAAGWFVWKRRQEPAE